MFAAGHLIDQTIKHVLEKGDDAKRERLAEHLRKECGMSHFKFTDAKDMGPGYESNGKCTWPSFTGDQLDQVRTPR